MKLSHCTDARILRLVYLRRDERQSTLLIFIGFSLNSYNSDYINEFLRCLGSVCVTQQALIRVFRDCWSVLAWAETHSYISHIYSFISQEFSVFSYICIINHGCCQRRSSEKDAEGLYCAFWSVISHLNSYFNSIWNSLIILLGIWYLLCWNVK